MDRSSYDTKAGIEAHLGSMEAFHMLLDARAGHEERGALGNWVVLGRFLLSSHATTTRFVSGKTYIPAEVFPGIPDVIPHSELHSRVSEFLGTTVNGDNFGTVFAYLPSPYVECGECQTGWTVRTMYDSVCDNQQEEISIDAFSGRTLLAAHQTLASERNTKADRRLLTSRWSTSYIRSESAADTKWRSEPPEYVIQPGDAAKIYIRQFMHQACQLERLEEDKTA